MTSPDHAPDFVAPGIIAEIPQDMQDTTDALVAERADAGSADTERRDLGNAALTGRLNTIRPKGIDDMTPLDQVRPESIVLGPSNVASPKNPRYLRSSRSSELSKMRKEAVDLPQPTKFGSPEWPDNL